MARTPKPSRRKADAAVAAAVLGAAAAATVGKVAHDRRARRDRAAARELRLRPDESIPDGMRRIARGQIDEAAERLRERSSEDFGEVVHEARKALKRGRSVGRLARAGIGQDAYDRHNTALRGAGRALSPARDGQVLVETIDDMRERFAKEIPHEAAGPLRDVLAREQEAAAGALQHDGTAGAVSADLDDAGRQVTAWAFDRDDFTALEPGLRRIYRQGRSAFRAARGDAAPERFHEWRKRVKDLWYMTSILGGAKPKPMKKIEKRAKALSKVLGEHHDLSVLREQAERRGGELEPSALAALLALIDRRQAQLQANALRAGSKLYADPPRKFTRRIERGWTKRMAVS